MPDRRSFLSGLATLPLIGGFVALIGRPKASAVPITPDLQSLYLGWLRLEHTRLMHEMVDRYDHRLCARLVHVPPFALPNAPSLIAAVALGSASSRAAVVMSAAGAPWWAAEPDCLGLEGRPQRKHDDPHLDPFKSHTSDGDWSHGYPIGEDA